MKAKVIETGEIVNISYSHFDYDNGIAVYKEVGKPRTWPVYELELYDAPEEKKIDWEQRRFELAKAALQGMATLRVWNDENDLADWSLKIADAVIEKLKKE